MPKVSVIIPAYNAMAYLPETIANVLEQTYTDFEVIIVNDGSTDNIVEWGGQISDSRVKLISQNNQGLAKTRNVGIEESQGEYLAFLDADDLWESTKLAKQVEVLDAHPQVGLVYNWVTYINQQGKSTGRTVCYQAEGDVWAELATKNLIECGSVPMIRLACLEEVGMFDEQLSYLNVGEDWDMWLRIAARYPFKVIPESLVYYRQLTGSASKNCELVAKSFRAVIEKAFADAPLELLPLRNKSYGNFYLTLGWKAIQSQAKDYEQASYCRLQALKHDPWLFFSQEHFRLSIAIAIMQWFGTDGYQQFLTFMYALRRGTHNIFSISQ
ncbi:glycosyl transferase family A [Pleurocapsa sp. CCALA 161]|uniref:glycosyltransferase family 2 protein n=1 Tax=Pleurocapsa sp. CCALA 161 TaxID=2107688 RepID=UPI000D070C0C|nr:glycosyltransferase family A protein [Pleurocapsa sp. CCALA 161]PSB08303.1 glycosyl transferase family A [Pleurocapsa sp. CCALA 161]